MRILAVGAQPCDLERVCGGTLARYAADGHSITMCVATVGVADTRTGESMEDRARAQEKEARDAARLIGADLLWLGTPGGQLADDGPTRMAFAEVMQATVPDVVVTHARDAHNPLHRLVSCLVFASVATAGSSGPESGSGHATVPRVFTMDTPTGKGFFPSEYVDVSSTMETKRRMLACHRDRLAWLQEHENVDASEISGALARARGFQCNVVYAEGYRIDDAWPNKSAERLLP